MKFKHYILLVAFTIGFVTTTYSQHRTFAIKNGFAVMGGISQYNIITDNFATKSRQGWVGGLSSTVDIPNEWYNVSFGMQVSENNLEISGRALEGVAGNEMIEYKLMAVQLGFTYHAKVIGDNVTIDFGPQIQYNGKLELKDETKEGYFINGYDSLTALDIADISQFNVNAMAGISAGIGSFKIKAQYIYGFLNILNKLNDKNLNVGSATEKFKGNQSMLVFAVMFSF
ncbi:MAG: hypothetical protein L3J25_06820 [Flavobacteriaceae bacterium]|nr:hypothetical protein [Flavobacteriaceae bacterium]